MARTKGSRNKGQRASRRTPWETYNYWYDKYTKGKKKGWFRDKLTYDEFQKMYKRAKELGYTNPARSVAMAQERISREGERYWKKRMGTDVPDLTDPGDRQEFFREYYDLRIREDGGLTHDDIEDEFKQYFY